MTSLKSAIQNVDIALDISVAGVPAGSVLAVVVAPPASAPIPAPRLLLTGPLGCASRGGAPDLANEFPFQSVCRCAQTFLLRLLPFPASARVLLSSWALLHE